MQLHLLDFNEGRAELIRQQSIFIIMELSKETVENPFNDLSIMHVLQSAKDRPLLVSNSY